MVAIVVIAVTWSHESSLAKSLQSVVGRVYQSPVYSFFRDEVFGADGDYFRWRASAVCDGKQEVVRPFGIFSAIFGLAFNPASTLFADFRNNPWSLGVDDSLRAETSGDCSLSVSFCLKFEKFGLAIEQAYRDESNDHGTKSDKNGGYEPTASWLRNHVNVIRPFWRYCLMLASFGLGGWCLWRSTGAGTVGYFFAWICIGSPFLLFSLIIFYDLAFRICGL